MISWAFRSWDKERVVAFTVHERGEPLADRIDRAEELTFVKDGFNFGAALFGPFWLLANGLWLAFVGYLVVGTAIGVGLSLLGIGGLWPVLGFVGLHLILGAEADSLKRFALEQDGWSAVGTVVGRNASECERRFFETWLPEQPLLLRGNTGHGSSVGPGSSAKMSASEAFVARTGSASGTPGLLGGIGSGVLGRRWWPFGN